MKVKVIKSPKFVGQTNETGKNNRGWFQLGGKYKRKDLLAKGAKLSKNPPDGSGQWIEISDDVEDINSGEKFWMKETTIPAFRAFTLKQKDEKGNFIDPITKQTFTPNYATGKEAKLLPSGKKTEYAYNIPDNLKEDIKDEDLELDFENEDFEDDELDFEGIESNNTNVTPENKRQGIPEWKPSWTQSALASVPGLIQGVGAAYFKNKVQPNLMSINRANPQLERLDTEPYYSAMASSQDVIRQAAPTTGSYLTNTAVNMAGLAREQSQVAQQIHSRNTDRLNQFELYNKSNEADINKFNTGQKTDVDNLRLGLGMESVEGFGNAVTGGINNYQGQIGEYNRMMQVNALSPDYKYYPTRNQGWRIGQGAVVQEGNKQYDVQGNPYIQNASNNPNSNSGISNWAKGISQGFGSYFNKNKEVSQDSLIQNTSGIKFNIPQVENYSQSIPGYDNIPNKIMDYTQPYLNTNTNIFNQRKDGGSYKCGGRYKKKH